MNDLINEGTGHVFNHVLNDNFRLPFVFHLKCGWCDLITGHHEISASPD